MECEEEEKGKRKKDFDDLSGFESKEFQKYFCE